jgi:hypothetical protein
MPPRRFPPPWTVCENAESFSVKDASGQALAWFYFRADPVVAHHAKVLIPMSVNFAGLPDLLWVRSDSRNPAQSGASFYRET